MSEETSPGGSRIFRHSGAKDFTPVSEEGQFSQLIEDHIAEHVGPIETVLQEIVSDLVHIDVHVVRLEDAILLITSGMSGLPMTAPEEAPELQYAELVMELPATWPLTTEAFKDEDMYWPIRLLKTLARLPHEYDTWLGWGHTIPNGDPPEPYAPNTKLSGALILAPLVPPDEFQVMETNDEHGTVVNFYSVVPLYEEEMNYKLEYGTEALLNRFQLERIEGILDPSRQNVCRLVK